MNNLKLKFFKKEKARLLLHYENIFPERKLKYVYKYQASYKNEVRVFSLMLSNNNYYLVLYEQPNMYFGVKNIGGNDEPLNILYKFLKRELKKNKKLSKIMLKYKKEKDKALLVATDYIYNHIKKIVRKYNYE